MRKSIIIIGASLFVALAVKSQAQVPTMPDATSFTNGPAPLQLIGSVLPKWDPSLTNTFKAHDMFFGAVPLWKTQTASGSTPYLSTSVGYFFTKHIGVEGELVSLGNGLGSSTLDSSALLAHYRKDSGNLAIHLMAGPSYDVNRSKAAADVGVGFEYRYANNLSFKADTRYSYGGSSPRDNGFKTRVGLYLNF
jgi:hypothetical protein